MLFHCDAVQAFGKIPVNVERDHIDLMSRERAQDVRAEGRGRAVCAAAESARPADGADGWRRTRRRACGAGTLNVPGIVGFGEACALAAREMTEECGRVRDLRDRLKQRSGRGAGRVCM